MTPIEIELARALNDCTFLPATAQKRFARNMAFLVDHSPEREISDKQRRYLCLLVQRYRRQIGDRRVQIAASLLAEVEARLAALPLPPPKPTRAPDLQTRLPV